jgi:O-antigen/teichoic acid export membrane protein
LVLYQQIDVVVISWTAASEDVGWYGTADTLFGSLLFPAVVVTATIFPSLGRLHVDDTAGLTDLVQRAFSTLIIVAVPIGLGTTLVAPAFAPQLYGEEFRETGTVLAILGPVIILTFGTILFGTVAQSTARVQLWIWVLLLAAFLTIPLDIVLVPWASDRYGNGAIGGALAYVITESVQFTIGLFVIAPFLVRRDIGWRVSRVLLAGAVMFAAGWPLRDAFVMIPIVACATVYVVLLFAFRVITDDERQLIGHTLQRVGIHTSWSN